MLDPAATGPRRALKHDLAADMLVVNPAFDYTGGVSVPCSLRMMDNALAVTSGGWVGVGTAHPVSKYHVNLPSDVETHNVSKYVLASSDIIDLKSTAISFTDPSVLSIHQALAHDVTPNALRLNNLLDFASVNIGADHLIVESGGTVLVNGSVLTVVGGQVGVNTATPAYGLDVCTSCNISGTLHVSTISALGTDLIISSPNRITLNAPEIDLTGNLNIVNKNKIDIEDHLLVLGKQASGVDVTDTVMDGCGIKLDHTFTNTPFGIDPASIEQSLRWRAKNGWYNFDGSQVMPANRSRWELSGGNFMIKGHHCSYMFAIDPTTCELQLYKVTVDPVFFNETQTLVGVFSGFVA